MAMPAVRSGRSTLGAELAIARAYLRLDASLEPRRAPWVCEADAALDDVPFPPLLLLPVLDALAGRAPAHAAPLRISAHVEDTVAVLALHGPAALRWLPDALLHRLRVGLHALHGSAAQVVVADGASADSAALTIRFPRAVSAPSTPQTPGGTSPWTRTLATTTTN
jgi:hypothetical protein